MEKPTRSDVIHTADVVVDAVTRLLAQHGPDPAEVALGVVDELARAEQLLPAGARLLLRELADRIEADNQQIPGGCVHLG